jgi:hypothetical protein
MLKRLAFLVTILALPILSASAPAQQQRTGQDQAREANPSVLPADTSSLEGLVPDTTNPADSLIGAGNDSLSTLPGDTIVGDRTPGGRVLPEPSDPTVTTPGVPPAGTELPTPGGANAPGPEVGPRPGPNGTSRTPPPGATGEMPTTGTTTTPPAGGTR